MIKCVINVKVVYISKIVIEDNIEIYDIRVELVDNLFSIIELTLILLDLIFI